MPPFQQSPKMPAKPTFVFAGTFTQTRGGRGKGIYAYWLQTGGMEVSQNIGLVPLGLVAETTNPTYLECDAKRRLLFAVNADPTGGVSAFSIDSSGKLTLINRQPSMGDGP